jgi:ribosomal protein S18 acetylase RimI-like enzyme
MSIWNIGDGRGATENIFTIPSYRRKNIAKEVIVTGLEELKKSGQTIGTLSMAGNNDKAMRLYQKLGYKLMYYMVEVQYVL